MRAATFIIWKHDALRAYVFYPIFIDVMMSQDPCTLKINVFRDSLCGLCPWNAAVGGPRHH